MGHRTTHGHIATTDFVDYAAHNFYPAAANSPQVNVVALASGDGIPRLDVADDVRPSYQAASYPNNLADVGPFEYDHGEGLAPISVTFADLQAGSTVRVFTTGTTTTIISSEFTIPANTPDRTHFYFHFNQPLVLI